MYGLTVIVADQFIFFLFVSHCKLFCYVQIVMVLFFSSHFSNRSVDVKINIITRVKDVTVVSRFDPRLVFSYAFFFVKIIHLLNTKPCFQIFFIYLCPAIIGFDDSKGIYMKDDSVLLLITHFDVLIMFTSSIRF